MRKLLLTAAAATAGFAMAAEAARGVKIVGSSTVFPYTIAVSETFQAKTRFSVVTESTGTGGGMKLFCRGLGPNLPDITGASRAMKPSEYKDCLKNGVNSITEVLLGYDGITIATSRESQGFDVSKADLYLALAAQVPVNGKIVDNPHKKWSDIRKDLPNTKIEVFGPPPTSGTRDAFVELAMQKGCMELQYFKDLKKELDKKAFKKVLKSTCSNMRLDGPFIEAGENDNLIVQRLRRLPGSVGIFGYSFLYENQDTIKPITVNGIAPSIDAIADGTYKISRPLYIYIKNQHMQMVPGIAEFVEEYTSEMAFGEDGYLVERGLVPLSDEERDATRERVAKRVHMDPPKEH